MYQEEFKGVKPYLDSNVIFDEVYEINDAEAVKSGSEDEKPDPRPCQKKYDEKIEKVTIPDSNVEEIKDIPRNAQNENEEYKNEDEASVELNEGVLQSDAHISNKDDHSEGEVLEYAKYIGIDIEEDKDLLWIARDGLKAGLPDDWEVTPNEDNDIVYVNNKTGEKTSEHPLDQEFKQLYKTKKAEKMSKRLNSATSESKRSDIDIIMDKELTDAEKLKKMLTKEKESSAMDKNECEKKLMILTGRSGELEKKLKLKKEENESLLAKLAEEKKKYESVVKMANEMQAKTDTILGELTQAQSTIKTQEDKIKLLTEENKKLSPTKKIIKCRICKANPINVVLKCAHCFCRKCAELQQKKGKCALGCAEKFEITNLY